MIRPDFGVERTPVPRSHLLMRLTELVAAARPPHPLRVAIDGPDTAGKTTLADELAAALSAHRPVVRAGIDGFHRPRAERLSGGNLSAEGYFRASFDHDAVISVLLAPLGPGGDRRYRDAVFDYRTDTPVDRPMRQAEPHAVLLFDGVFLLRQELRPYWDLGIFLAVGAAETLRRAVVRDLDLFGSEDEIRRRYTARYLPGQRIYRETARPADRANVVIDHDDPANPVVLKWPDEQPC